MKTVLIIQSFYFALFSLWPLIHIKSFERVSGQKKEDWLVYTVSLLLIADAMTMGVALIADDLNLTVRVLALSSAAALIIIDVVFVYKGTLKKIYLADAFIEMIFLLLLLFIK